MMAKLTVFIKYLDDDGSISDWQSAIDVESGSGQSKGLLERLRLLVRRELIARRLITPTDEDTKRRR